MGNKVSSNGPPPRVVSGEWALSNHTDESKSTYCVTIETSTKQGFGIDQKHAVVSIILYGDGNHQKSEKKIRKHPTNDEEDAIYVIGTEHRLNETNLVDSLKPIDAPSHSEYHHHHNKAKNEPQQQQQQQIEDPQHSPQQQTQTNNNNNGHSSPSSPAKGSRGSPLIRSITQRFPLMKKSSKIFASSNRDTFEITENCDLGKSCLFGEN